MKTDQMLIEAVKMEVWSSPLQRFVSTSHLLQEFHAAPLVVSCSLAFFILGSFATDVTQMRFLLSQDFDAAVLVQGHLHRYNGINMVAFFPNKQSMWYQCMAALYQLKCMHDFMCT